jgi:hypothetical protein
VHSWMSVVCVAYLPAAESAHLVKHRSIRKVGLDPARHGAGRLACSVDDLPGKGRWCTKQLLSSGARPSHKVGSLAM